jgi:uncharacterized protein
MRLAAVADLHARAGDEDRIAALLRGLRDEADVLALAGDLTDHGRSEEMESLVRGVHDVEIPVVAVLGNHDHEGGHEKDLFRMLGSAGIHILDRRRPTVAIDGVGFAGVKGFGGGFGDRVVRAFGEEPLKMFVSASVVEAEALRAALVALDTPRKVALLHYAPVSSTVEGEPSEIWPFLGTSRLEQAIDEGGAHLALHGHAHHGAMHGKTARGIPVHNVSLPVLRAAGHEKAYVVLDV